MHKKKLLTQHLSNQSDKGDVLTSGKPLNKEVSAPRDTYSSLIYKDGKWVKPSTTKSPSVDNFTQ